MNIKRLFLLLILTTLSFSQSNKGFPYGNITMFDNSLQKNVPIEGVEIEIRSNGTRFKVYTDSLGNFALPLLKRDHVEYRLNWRYRNDAFAIRTNSTGIAYIQGPKQSSYWNLSIPDSKNRFYGTIFRAGSRYMRSQWVTPTDKIRNIGIKAYYNRKPAGKGAARYIAITENMQVWGRNKWNERLTEIRLFSYVAHEFAHTHHDAFYFGGSQYAKTELRLRESWAEAAKFFVTRAEYGDTCTDVKRFSKQHPRLDGWQNNDWRFGRRYYTNYTPFMIDLVDSLDQAAVKDRVSGYTMRQIQIAMEQPDCRDLSDLARILKGRYDNPTEIYLDELLSEMEEQ